MAGVVDWPGSSDDESAGLDAVIEAATELTRAQRRAMLEIYRSFLDANVARRIRAE
jgi:hypothetical protein